MAGREAVAPKRPYGVFVIETKNMKGWIFGGEHDAQWTQKIHRGHSQTFQNPLRQNLKHTETLVWILVLPREKVFSCIAFGGDAKLKTRDRLPANVRVDAGWVTFVKSHRDIVLGPDDIAAILEKIEAERLAPGLRTHRQHVQYVKWIKEQPAAVTADAQSATVPVPVLVEGSPCPRCGGRLLARTARQGANAGKAFLGCSNYPRCRFVG